MNYDIVRDGLKIRDKYWEDQWLINELEALRSNYLQFLKNQI